MKRMTPARTAAGCLALLLAACAAPPSGPVQRVQREAASTSYAQPPQDHPGLGTRWGENRASTATQVRFVRANPGQPLAAAAVFYNDRSGIDAMVRASALRRVMPELPSSAATLVSFSVRDQSGRLLPGVGVGDRWFVVGDEGRRYAIVVKNRSNVRLETVLSVDGLDVLDGRPASWQKRGYIIAPRGTLVVDGFRRSLDTVAAFRFSPVRESYAQEKYRDTRNVGVIGLAVFDEEGSSPFTGREIKRRLQADPFPHQFATPP